MKGKFVRTKVMAILLVILLLAITTPVSAGINTDTYNDISATITAPDTVEPNTNFNVSVSGAIGGGSAFSIFAYGFYENATWTYDSNHKISFPSGTLLDGSGFNWGSSFSKTYVLSRPGGTYKYTFFFGQRSFGHGYYDVAVDVYVIVREAGPKLCDGGWKPPLSDIGKAGQVVPLKFTAYTCTDGSKDFYRDETVTVTIENSTGTVVDSFSYTGNPHTGVDIDQTGQMYHVNWDTAKYMVGTYTIKVIFNLKAFLTRNITLQ